MLYIHRVRELGGALIYDCGSGARNYGSLNKYNRRWVRDFVAVNRGRILSRVRRVLQNCTEKVSRSYFLSVRFPALSGTAQGSIAPIGAVSRIYCLFVDNSFRGGGIALLCDTSYVSLVFRLASAPRLGLPVDTYRFYDGNSLRGWW